MVKAILKKSKNALIQGCSTSPKKWWALSLFIVLFHNVLGGVISMVGSLLLGGVALKYKLQISKRTRVE